MNIAPTVGVSQPAVTAYAGMSREVARWASLGVQLSLLLVLATAFHIESPAFYLRILPLAVAGAVLHQLQPAARRPWVCAALGITGVFLVFGLWPGAWLVGLSLGLIGLCHVPIAFRWRVVLVALTGAGLMVLRAGWMTAPWPGVIWPVLGSMFMFRLGLYLYDLKYRKGPAEPGLILSYFFLLPNVVFLLFPVIDYGTFRRTYYDRPALTIYEEGAQWMLRGLTHLVLYRLIYTYAVIGPAEVVTTAGIVRYLVSNYGLYLRVSGQFHLIVGMLHLYGFRLPETHRFFYLASNVSDFWRRINIYWKDFMQKAVYLPAVMGLKGQGETTAVVGATLCVLGASWLLRSYQWFWILGRWLISAPDIIFWGLLGTLLVANTLREQRRGRARQLTARGASAHTAWRGALQTAGMFVVMCVLWGFWTSETIGDFWTVLTGATLRVADVMVVVGTLAVVIVAAYLSQRYGWGAPSALATRRWWQHPLVNAALPLALLWLVGEPELGVPISAPVQALAQQTRTPALNATDADRLQRGYYEKITGIERTNSELWELYARAEPARGADADDSPLQYINDRFGNHWHAPNQSVMFKHARFTTNRWGMRDRDYELTAPPRTWRIALLGPSYLAGAGVNDGEPFEALVESRLNREWTPRTGLRYELLNFGLSATSLDDHVRMLTSGLVGQFRPDVVLMIGQQGMNDTIILTLWHHMDDRKSPSEFETTWRRTAGVEPDMLFAEARRRLLPYSPAMLRSAFDAAASAITRLNAIPSVAFIPVPSARPRPATSDLMSAREAGFRIIDMDDVFAGRDVNALRLNDADLHPNAEGHRVIADRLYTELTKSPGLLSAADGATPSRSDGTGGASGGKAP